MTTPKVHFVAIAGGSGSGKTWLAQKLADHFGPRAGRISADDFYRDLSHLPEAERGQVNFDHPRAIDWPLFQRTLLRIRAGLPAGIPAYDLVSHTRVDRLRPWAPCPLVILDGLWLLRRIGLRRLYRLSVFIDCPESLRLERRLARDAAERGRTLEAVHSQFRHHVAPMHSRFVAPQFRHADLVLSAGEVSARVDEIAGRLRALLTESAAAPAP